MFTQLYTLNRVASKSLFTQVFLVNQRIVTSRKFSNEVTQAQKVKPQPINLKEASQSQEFYGLPLKKMQPQNEQDLLFKLNQKFTSLKDLLNFFEANRSVFQESPSSDSYRLLFAKILSYSSQKQDAKSPQADILSEPQFKVALQDYNRYLGIQSTKFKQHTVKDDLFDSFIPILETLVMLHRGKRFKSTFPEYIRNTYLNMMNQDAYLNKQSHDQIASLLYVNASPHLMNLKINTITSFAHKLANILSSSDVSLNELSEKSIFEIVYGFGQLHLIPHAELLYKLEPYIIMRISEFNPDKLNQIAGYYLRLQCGTQDFLKQLITKLSMRQDNASFNSQAQLLGMLDPKIMNRKEFKLDLNLEVRLIAKSMIKKINQLKADQHLPIIVPRFLYHQLGIKGYYEMLAIEYVKHIDRFNFKNKTRLLYWFAQADIDSSYILKTAHKLCSSYSEAFHYKTGNLVDLEGLPKLGLYTEQQIRYITDASKDIRNMHFQIAKIEKQPHEDDQTAEKRAEETLKKHQDKIEFEETQGLLKMVWGYMVFCQSGKDYENKVLWEKLSDLINKKLKTFPDEYQLSSIDLDNLHQINAFLKLEMEFVSTKLIKIPQNVNFDTLRLSKTSANKEQEYHLFVAKVHKFFKEQSIQLPQNSFYDFYRLYGAQNLDSSNPRDRAYFVFNQKNWYFEDSKTHNAFVRIRREHLRKLGVIKLAEIDFYDYLEFKKRHTKNAQSKKGDDSDEDETLFTLKDEQEDSDEDAIIAYLKSLIKNVE